MEHLLLSLFMIVFLGAAGLELIKPDVEWKPCNCKEPLAIALSGPDFIKHIRYVKGLEYEVDQCQKKPK